MLDSDMITRYNYDEFVPQKVFHWLNFDNSPLLGQPAPDFPLWDLEAGETRACLQTSIGALNCGA